MAPTNAQKPNKSPHIYDYLDYRKFLKDFYDHKKRLTHGYSYRAFSKAAGFSAPNILKLVIEGQRNIGEKALPKFVKALKLIPAQAEYFHALVLLNQAKDDGEKEKYYLQLKKLIPHAKKRLLKDEMHHFLSHWLNPVLREMVELPNFRYDPYAIANQLVDSVTVNEIETCFLFLLEENFIARQDDGSYKATDKMILSPDEILNLSIRNYHRNMLQLAAKVIDKVPLEQREFGALTVKLPKSALKELKEKIKKFRHDIHLWSLEALENQLHEENNEEDPSIVIQLNYQMFPPVK